MEKFKNEYGYLIHLLKSILNTAQPEEKPENLSFEKIFNISKHHGVANMSYYAIEKLEKKPDSQLAKKWADDFNGLRIGINCLKFFGNLCRDDIRATTGGAERVS